MALHGTLSTLRQQLAHPEHFRVAFEYLEEALNPQSAVAARIRALAPGQTERVDLPGEVFALEQAYRTKPRAEGRFEAHRKYVDLQAIIAGAERMEVLPADRLELEEDLLESKDVCFFRDVQTASIWRVEEGEVAVFFPADAHMPSLALEAPAIVFKTVVKVPVPA